MAKFNDKISTKINSFINEKSIFEKKLYQFEDKLKRRQLLSPIDGIIKSINVFTVGGVVKAGETIIEIVPENDNLIVKAELPVSDIGFINIGDKVNVRLSGSHALYFNSIVGIIKNISPDAMHNRSNDNTYYQVFYNWIFIRFYFWNRINSSLKIIGNS